MLQYVRELRSERQYAFELYQQFSEVELMTPVSEMLERLIVKRLAERNGKNI